MPLVERIVDAWSLLANLPRCLTKAGRRGQRAMQAFALSLHLAIVAPRILQPIPYLVSVLRCMTRGMWCPPTHALIFGLCHAVMDWRILVPISRPVSATKCVIRRECLRMYVIALGLRLAVVTWSFLEAMACWTCSLGCRIRRRWCPLMCPRCLLVHSPCLAVMNWRALEPITHRV
mmetsp:Transcript_69080/g.225214  ORF Transcript_69080/g.225214 Transcript_69080/m.225214 type:complete len:176 (+) Transcript_69080:2149-2676(+)